MALQAMRELRREWLDLFYYFHDYVYQAQVGDSEPSLDHAQQHQERLEQPHVGRFNHTEVKIYSRRNPTP